MHAFGRGRLAVCMERGALAVGEYGEEGSGGVYGEGGSGGTQCMERGENPVCPYADATARPGAARLPCPMRWRQRASSSRCFCSLPRSPRRVFSCEGRGDERNTTGRVLLYQGLHLVPAVAGYRKTTSA